MNPELLVRNVAAHWVQSGLMVVSALIAIRLLRAGEPRLRLACLHLTLAATLLLPLMQPWRPLESAAGAVAVTVASATASTRILPTSPEPTRSALPGAHAAVLAVVIAGIVLRIVWLCAGLIHLRRFRARAREIPAPHVARDLEAMLGVAPRYLEHAEHASPASFGMFGAVVVLPPTFASLDASVQQAVVCHELLHVKRHDAAAAFFEELIGACLWFHPWSWLLHSRIRLERELVVDRQVVHRLGNRDRYVRCLVAMSGHDLVPHLSAGMANARELRTRIDAVLDEGVMSRTRTAIALIALMMLGTGTASLGRWVVPLRAQDYAGVERPGRSPQQNNTYQTAIRRAVKVPAMEYPEDALEKGIGGSVVIDVAINAAGDVTTAAVASGPEELRVGALKAVLELRFEPRSETTALQVVVKYDIRSDSAGVSMWWGDGRSRHAVGGRRTPLYQDATAVVWEQNKTMREVPPPKKIKDVAPHYPAAAEEARVQGTVILEATIDEKGHVSDVRLVRSIPLLDQAAIDAVKLWDYEPTIVDGIAVPVTVTVTVNFVRDARYAQ